MPNAKIPVREKWLYKNKKALKTVSQGLEDAVAGRVKSKGSFASSKEK